MMPLSKKLKALTLALFIFNITYAQCDWETIGLDNDLFFIADSSNTYKPAIASDNAGVEYVVYCDAQNSAKATVKRYVNGYWTTMGNAGFSDGRVDLVRIATDNLNHVFVAYQDHAHGRKVTVKYFNGLNWVNVGTPGFSPVKIDDLDFTIDRGTNKPYVAFADSTARISVMDFDGNAWNTVGTTGFSYGMTSGLGIVASGNVPYVSYIDYGHSYNMYVMKYDGIAWDSLGTLSSLGNGQPTIALDNSNVPHLAFMGNGLGNVIYYNGASWQNLGVPFAINGSMFYHDLTFDASNNAYLAYSNFGSAQTADLAKYDGTSWSVLGQMSVPINQSITYQWARFVGLTINNSTQEPFMLYSQNNAQPLLGMRDYGVLKWNGADFENTNGTSITGSVSYGIGGYSAKFNFDPFGVPYVVYTDSTYGHRVSVKKFIGTEWVQVGSPGFSTFDTEFNHIDFDANGKPYVAFREQTASPSVMTFNGTAWEYVGAPMFYPAANGVYISLAVNRITNEPYIFFNDQTLASRGTCMRFNGSNWVNVGPAGFTAGGVGKTSMKFNATGTPYVAYPDNAYGSKIAMMKFNGSSWVGIGSGAISAGQVFNFGFDIDAADNVFLAYTDVSQSYRVICKKFDGSSWSSLGTPLTSGYASDCDVAVDASGNAFVYFTEQFLNYYPGTVKRFFNNTWITVGRQQIFNGITQSNCIRKNPVTGLPVIGSYLRGDWGEARGYYLKSLPCNFNTAVTGNVFYDADANCLDSNSEPVIPNTPVILNDGVDASLTFTDNGGNYYFTAIPAGPYTIGTGSLQNGYNIQCANSQPHSITVSANSLNTENFAVACTPQFDFIASSLVPIGSWWPGQQVSLVSHAFVDRTVCAATPTPGTIKLAFPPCLKYVADTTLLLQPSSVQVLVTGDTITYNVPDVYNYSPFLLNSLITRALICTTATFTDTLCIQLIVSAINDVNPLNNVYERCIAIATSYDPNTKEVNPRGMGSEGFISSNSVEMNYTINFQNTGTAPAVNIVLKDTISANLDISSFQIIASSHAMSGTSISNNVVSFNFPDIMLPDSTSDQLNSHGFVSYKINLKPNLAPLTQIKNTAYIYFDYNAPVITNTTLNTIELLVGIKDIKFPDALSIFPNPTSGNVSLSRIAERIELYDMKGASVGAYNNCSTFSTEHLANGIYLVRAIEKNGILSNFKLVKEK